MTDVFQDGNAVQVGYFKFDKIGDKIQGTYIEKVHIPAKGIYQPQIGYKLKTDKGVMIAAFGENKTFTHDCMGQAKLGQIVGFKYEADFETEASKKDKNISPAKTIKVFLGDMDKTYMVADVFGGTEVKAETEEIKVDEVPFE